MSDPAGLVCGYLTLALRLNRLVPGLVEAGLLDPRLRRLVAAESGPQPADLVRQAGRLIAELPATPMPVPRRAFLAGQLRAVECAARRLAGQPIGFRAEIAACFGLAVRMGDPDEYAVAHAELADLLSGRGPLADRLAAYRHAHQVPADRLGPALRTLSARLRERTGALVGLPAGEAVRYRVVADGPWGALHQYRGGYRSLVTVNAAARPRRDQLVQLVAHEAYPGHHVQRCRKQAGLIDAGWSEHAVVVVNSPQSLLAEGAAELGLPAVLGPGWGGLAAAELAGHGLGFDGELAERVAAVLARLARVRQDAALLLHDRGAAADEVLGHLGRWLLVDRPRAERILRFLRHPVWRAYTTTYVEGPELLRPWWARDPGPDRLRRLLDEPLTPDAIRAELMS